MNSSDSTPAEPPTLTGLLARHCLKPDGTPADHARGSLAGLRKLLSATTRNQGLFALGQLGFVDWERDPSSLIVAALFGLHPHRCEKWRNFGTTCRDLAVRGGDARPGDSPFDRHFRRILASRTLDDIAKPILTAGRMAKASGKSIHFPALHKDLVSFSHDPDPILERWAKSYFDAWEPGESPATAA